MRAEQRQDLAGVERARHDHVRTDRERRQRPQERADVRHRRTREERVGVGELEAVDRAGHHPAERVEAVGDALRRTGAAGREEDGGRVARCGVGASVDRARDRRRRAARAWGRRRASLPAPICSSPPASALAARSSARSACATIARAPLTSQRVVDLGVRVPVVERRGDEPGAEAREVVHEQEDAVRQQRRDPVTAARARAPRSCGRAGRWRPRARATSSGRSRSTTATASGSASSPTRQQIAQIDGRVERRVLRAACGPPLLPPADQRSSRNEQRLSGNGLLARALSYGADPWGLTSTEVGCS